MQPISVNNPDGRRTSGDPWVLNIDAKRILADSDPGGCTRDTAQVHTQQGICGVETRWKKAVEDITKFFDSAFA